ncbi:MAG: efflux RND transporter periplasmic adaptor subunit [Chloroflexota bacterium]
MTPTEQRSTGSTPGSVPNGQRDSGNPAPRSAPHRPPRPLIALVLLAAVAGTLWWQMGFPMPARSATGLLTASGTLEADEVLIGSEVSGRLLEIAREGDSVPTGSMVARLDDSLLQLQFRQVDTATQQQLSIQADRYRLRTSVGGIVTRVPMKVGEVVSPGQTVLAVADLADLKLTAYVLERDMGKVRIGQAVDVTADPFPGRVFRGRVTATNQRAEFTPRNIQTQRDRLNLVFGITIRVENPDLALKPGMPADVAFPPLD